METYFMKYTSTIIAITAAAAILGCGTSSNSTSEPFTILSNLEEIVVVEGMKKDIQLSSNREDVSYTFIDNTQAPITELNPNTGVLIYRSDSNTANSSDEITVQAVDANGNKSNVLTLTFNIVSATVAVNREVVQTGADDNGSGLARVFTENSAGNIVDPLGNEWENDLSGDKLEAFNYLSAELNRCETLNITSTTGANWRLPSKDELLNLIDYSKSAGNSMLDSPFVESNLTLWAKTSNEKYYSFSQTSGLVYEASIIDKYPVRCINAPVDTARHVVSTDRFTDITYDFSTGLQWSPMVERLKFVDDVNQTASEYCSTFDGGSGWRLPSFNEVRSIVENDTISTLIFGNNNIMISSTRYPNSDTTAKDANYLIRIDENGIYYGAGYVDDETIYPISCVKEI